MIHEIFHIASQGPQELKLAVSLFGEICGWVFFLYCLRIDLAVFRNFHYFANFAYKPPIYGQVGRNPDFQEFGPLLNWLLWV